MRPTALFSSGHPIKLPPLYRQQFAFTPGCATGQRSRTSFLTTPTAFLRCQAAVNRHLVLSACSLSSIFFPWTSEQDPGRDMPWNEQVFPAGYRLCCETAIQSWLFLTCL